MMWWNGANPAMAWIMAITMLVVMVVFVGVVVWAVVLLARSLSGRLGPRRPLQLLDERYAQGEITTEDYEDRRRRLLSAGLSGPGATGSA